MSKSPVSVVKEKFGEKAKLVEALKAFMTEDLWVNRLNETKGLDRVSNAKLLRLHRIFSAVQGEFGSRTKLIDSILAFDGQGKDDGLRTKLNAFPVPRLYDLYRSKKRTADNKKRTTTAAAPAAKA